MSGYPPGEVRLVEAIRAHLGEESFRELLRRDAWACEDEHGMWCLDANGWTWFLTDEGLACKTVHDGMLFVGVVRDGDSISASRCHSVLT